MCRFLLGLEVGDHHECCHTCDNPWCINPDHLYIGTIDDNIDDMIERGRSNRGERHWNWKGGVSKNYRTGANRRKGPDDKPFDDRRTVWKT